MKKYDTDLQTFSDFIKHWHRSLAIDIYLRANATVLRRRSDIDEFGQRAECFFAELGDSGISADHVFRFGITRIARVGLGCFSKDGEDYSRYRF